MRNQSFSFLIALLFIFTQSLVAQNISQNFKENSILRSGSFYKIAIASDGLYKIDHSFISKIDENLGSIDAKKVKIFGQGGGIIPEHNIISRVDDMEEIPSLRQGLDDGSWDDNDYLIFYAEGPDSRKQIDDSNEYQFTKNIYSENNYYFIQIDGDDALSMPVSGTNIPSEKTFTDHTSIQRIEEDKINLLADFQSTEGSGKLWFGDQYYNVTEQSYQNQFDFNDVDFSKSAFLKASFAGRSYLSTEISIETNNESFTKTIGFSQVGQVLKPYARLAEFNESFILTPNSPINVNFNNKGDNEAKAWMDYLEIQVFKTNNYKGNPILLRHTDMLNYPSVSFEIQNGNENLQAWDVTNNVEPFSVKIENGNVVTCSTEGLLRDIIVFEKQSITAKPTFVGAVNNQNLHNLNNIEYVIISYKDFIPAGEKLANYYRDNTDLSVTVVDVDHIYNEFSSGRLDPCAIRDFLRMLKSKNNAFNYVLLLGDGSYDQRGIDPGLGFKNFIPVYETLESLSPINAFPTDDFFGLLDDSEGDNLKGALDVSIGRLPANTIQEATTMIDKIIHYQTDDSFGPWRTFLGFGADDQDGDLHISDANEIAEIVEDEFIDFNQRKIYFDAYPQESTPGGERYPLVTADLIKNIENGQLVQCYLGHGGPTGWAQERVLQANHINALNNYDKLCLFVTATCSFTGYDDPSIVSAGEHAILNPNGGAVALFTTTRAVYTNANRALTESVFKYITKKIDGQPYRLGEIMRLGKNVDDTLTINSRKFTLIGDPAMQLNIPEHSISVTSFNGNDIQSGLEMDTIKALQKVNLKGKIENYQQSLLEDFNGVVNIVVYDKETDISTLQNNTDSDLYTFNIRNNIVFKGSATVTNGLFDVDFIIPKDIKFNFGTGRISMYANNGVTDAVGTYESFIIGGSSINTITDNKGPEIELFMNDESFVYGGITNDEPIFLAKLSDENGINISGTSIGHDLTGIFNNDDQNPVIMNEYYEATIDNYRSGEIRFPIDKLEPGKYKIKLTAWDILNNVSEKEIEFNVVHSDNEGLSHVLNYPNPFSSSTEFMFEHDLVNSNNTILVKIFSLSGKLIKTIERESFSTGFRENGIMWNGRDDFGSRIANGIYLYKISIHDNDNNITKESSFEKLVILN